jgi:hypothetical protein
MGQWRASQEGHFSVVEMVKTEVFKNKKIIGEVTYPRICISLMTHPRQKPGEDHLIDLGVDGRIILKLTLND